MTGIAASSLPRSILLPVSRHWSEIAASVYGAAVVGLVAGSSGGFLPTTWGWTAVITLWLAAIALIVREEIRIRTLELVYLGGMLGFTAWVALSNFWTPSVTSTMHEVQRGITYTGVVVAGLVLVQRRAVRFLLGGVLVGIALDSLYGLGTRLLPDRFGGFDSGSFDYRLAAPINYWNGLGIFAVMGMLLGLGFAARARWLVIRAVAAAVLPLFAVTMYFTFSRGAWYALGVGLIAAIVIDPRRLQLVLVTLLLTPWCAFAIAMARQRPGLVTVGATFDQATHDGHKLAPFLLLLAAGSALTGTAVAILERHITVPGPVRIVFAGALVAALAAGIAGVWVKEGSPAHLAERGWRAFKGPASHGKNGNVSARLLSLSADGRIPLWKVAFSEFESAPILGQGAGTFSETWAKHREIGSNTTQAHSLYIGAMDELGIVGLALLVLLVLAPIVGAIWGRGSPLIPAAAGAFVAWAAHAGIDWDWQLPGVTIPALLCAIALVKVRPRSRPRIVGTPGRVVGVAVVTALLVASVPVLVADLRLRRAEHEVSTRPAAALGDARAARALAPWSSEPYRVAADAYQFEHRPRKVAEALRQAVSRDSSSWALWRLLANATSGSEHRAALKRAKELNPIEASRS